MPHTIRPFDPPSPSGKGAASVVPPVASEAASMEASDFHTVKQDRLERQLREQSLVVSDACLFLMMLLILACAAALGADAAGIW